MQLQNVRQLISNFVRGLESHPNGQEIIRLVEEILDGDSGLVNPSLISSLKKLSRNNFSLLTDFWILRASILKEEGRHQQAMRIFFEATQWRPTELSTWLRIIDFFKDQQEYLRASFFLVQAQQLLDSPNYAEDLDQILQQLYRNLTLPLGNAHTLNEEVLDMQYEEEIAFDGESTTEEFDSVSPELQVEFKSPYTISSEALSLWEQALECFEEGTNGDNLIYLQAFIHYAHSTVREILQLDENFKNGLERQIAKFGLFKYKKFFIKLNQLRNAVIHDNYTVSKEEAKGIHSQITGLFKK
jgi:tetratricopeptide (TPR) repeat protein